MSYLQNSKGRKSSSRHQSVIGFIDGSKSKILHPSMPHGVPNFTGSLINKDIDGTNTGTLGNKYIKTMVCTIHSGKKSV